MAVYLRGGYGRISASLEMLKFNFLSIEGENRMAFLPDEFWPTLYEKIKKK